MATTTPNFGWPVPTSTDLVKDGATAIEALGDGIDTSMVDLKGGTTGQILAKATNADMDFAWITNDVGDITAITASSPLTGGGTSGDVTIGILDGTTSNKGAVQLSTSTSSTSTSLAATASAVKAAYDLAASNTGSSNVAGKNAVLNSGFNVWQRGTAATAVTSGSVSFMLADRWNAYRGATGSTVSRQATNDTTNLPNIQFCHRFQRDSGNTSTANLNLIQNFETVNSIPFAGKQVTLSFYARAGANYSATSNALLVWLRNGTGTDQNFLSGYTGVNDVITGSATLTTTWQRFTFSGTVPTNSTELAIQIQANPTGTAGANDWFETTGVQLEMATTVSAYSPNTSNYALELAACQRYYFRTTQNANLILGAYGNATSTTVAYIPVPYPVTMRVTPTALDYSSVYLSDTVNALTGIGSVTLGTSSNELGEPAVTINAGSLTQFRTYKLVALTNGGYVGFSAEL